MALLHNHPLVSNFAAFVELLPALIQQMKHARSYFSAQMTNDVTTNNGVGNTQHLYFISRYDIQDQLAVI